MSGAVVYTWIYQNTCGTLLLAILLHTSVNVCAQYFFFPAFGEGEIVLAWWLLAGLWFVVARVIVAVIGPNRVRRGVPVTVVPHTGQSVHAK